MGDRSKTCVSHPFLFYPLSSALTVLVDERMPVTSANMSALLAATTLEHALVASNTIWLGQIKFDNP